ncbi:hypothetical protein Moror_6364 [Moniliophthora roreri MCA 2997]|uniref:Xylanolytic transcriptional activator regulatory domain-containing protein n=1 Tax=Moniliophthora roreri (strain MCA 2997) TaxID=1381753 RepID=V2XDA4_MONRO|nr:hypothetical protein Moror_6364 [Moniliophthora roreri MCA 2997]
MHQIWIFLFALGLKAVPRRKVRCDGQLPACRRCVAGGHGEDCEYDTSSGTTRIQLLEQQIAQLEAKLRKLQDSADHDPVTDIQIPGRTPGPSKSAPRASEDFPFVPVPRVKRISKDPDLNLPANWWVSNDLPDKISKLLVDSFAPNALLLGFFLHGPRFLESMFSSKRTPPLPRPAPSLISVIHLVGIQCSPSKQFREHESLFLQRALQAMDANRHPRYVVHNIQAEILLTHYFLRIGKFGQAMHRLNSAMSLAISCGLHKQSTHHSPASYQLPPPIDGIERGERLDAFWAVVLLHKAWGVSLQWPSRISALLDDIVDTPLPLDIGAYESGDVATNPEGYLTLQVLGGAVNVDKPPKGASTWLGASVKAAVLFERATYLGIQWQSVMNDPEEMAQMHPFIQYLTNFVASLPSISACHESALRHSWLVTQSLAHAAVIQLGSAFDDPQAKQSCLASARAAVRVLKQFRAEEPECEDVNSLLGTTWTPVCKVLIRAISEIDQRKDPTNSALREELRGELWTVISAMTLFGIHCAVIRSQLNQIQQQYAFS